MLDIIQLLPDSVANQIAAGEVIQRPASVVKELMENSIDAKSTKIKVFIKDAGKSLIQVTDNGIGMSETDARMCFERHTTSKIKKANDLFVINTKGFRGEALASISSVSKITLKTKRKIDELGTLVEINGSEIIEQEIINCQNGGSFIVKNLFFNVPARRRFLKSNSTELRHIISEFQKLSLSHSDIEMSLYNNDNEIFLLKKSNLRERISLIFGRKTNQNILSIKTETSIIKIKGFLGKAESARKTYGEQFFFVNNRYMRHPYFHKAILLAYENILPPETFPTYFIYFEVDTNEIDINIHPTKTEIKFVNERAIFQIILAVVKEAMGKFNVLPPIDFDNEERLDIPYLPKFKKVQEPEIKIDPNYNPFRKEKNNKIDKINIENWQKLYENFEKEENIEIVKEPKNISFDIKEENEFLKKDGTKDFFDSNNFFQLKNKYILTQVKSGLMLINQKYAHQRILFDNFIKSLNTNSNTVQKSLFQQKIQLNSQDAILLKEILNDIKKLGFDISFIDKTNFLIKGTPSNIISVFKNIKNLDFKELIESLIENYKYNKKLDINIKENLAKSLAISSSIRNGDKLTKKEMSKIIDELFACKMPNFSPNGKKIIKIISLEELDKYFEKV